MGAEGSVKPAKGDALPLDQARSYLDEKRRQANIHVVSPLQTVLSDAFTNYPLTTTFVSIFATLSFIPLATFAGFALFVGSVLVGGAALFVIFWGALIIGIAACVLLFTLGVTLFISLLVTGFFTSVFLSLRFVAQVSQSDGGMIQGVKNFGAEVRQRAVGGSEAQPARKHLRASSSSSSKRDSAASVFSTDAPSEADPKFSPSSSSSDSWKMDGERVD